MATQLPIIATTAQSADSSAWLIFALVMSIYVAVLAGWLFHAWWREHQP